MTLDEKIREASALIREVFLNHSEPACVTCSFQTDCMAIVDLLIAQRPEIPVLFLDTGYHFSETYAYRDQMVRELKLNLVNLVPKLSVAAQESQFGMLHRSGPDRCCAMRKVDPLFAGLGNYGVWFTALRREQSPTRANLQALDQFRLPAGKELLKVSPLAAWTNAEVWAYLKRRGIPVLPLYEKGYTSIGCEPCTTLPLDPENLRSGRWGGRKLECGIHISSE